MVIGGNTNASFIFFIVNKNLHYFSVDLKLSDLFSGFKFIAFVVVAFEFKSHL